VIERHDHLRRATARAPNRRNLDYFPLGALAFDESDLRAVKVGEVYVFEDLLLSMELETPTMEYVKKGRRIAPASFMRRGGAPYR
jgi:hypothetical protein